MTCDAKPLYGAQIGTKQLTFGKWAAYIKGTLLTPFATGATEIEAKNNLIETCRRIDYSEAHNQLNIDTSNAAADTVDYGTKA